MSKFLDELEAKTKESWPALRERLRAEGKLGSTPLQAAGAGAIPPASSTSNEPTGSFTGPGGGDMSPREAAPMSEYLDRLTKLQNEGLETAVAKAEERKRPPAATPPSEETPPKTETPAPK